jgi:hypothetical protein
MCVGFLNNFQFRQASDSGGGLCRNGARDILRWFNLI